MSSFPETPPEVCPFCPSVAGEIIDQQPTALALNDQYPSSPGHTLIVPRRHVADFFQLKSAEQRAMLSLLFAAQKRLQAELSPDGYNIGVNVGRTGGQTIGHVHLHLIPRFRDDTGPSRPEGPKGGVRWVLPETAAYWEQAAR